MGKKARRSSGGGGSAGPSAPFWMVTYSDMVTLLLTFFVMLLSMANFEEVGRVEAVFESIRMALGVGARNTLLVGQTEDPANQPKELQEPDKLQPVMSKLQEALARHVSDSMVKMTRTRTEVRVSLDDRVLFAPGSSKLHPAAYALLGDLSRALSDDPVKVMVEGHTDSTGDAEGNWRLSANRAVSVVVAMEEKGLPGVKMEAQGFGQHRPASATGGTTDWNRRVELVIQSESPMAYDALYEVERLTGGIDGR
jgi:chemotaxis protein MotB